MENLCRRVGTLIVIGKIENNSKGRIRTIIDQRMRKSTGACMKPTKKGSKSLKSWCILFTD